MYNEGISKEGDLIDTGVKYGVVAKTGNSFSFGETKLGVGREKAKTYLRENPKIYAEILKAIKEKIKE
jgi:recombination protein RecA